jgi:hypothetical protein
MYMEMTKKFKLKEPLGLKNRFLPLQNLVFPYSHPDQKKKIRIKEQNRLRKIVTSQALEKTK